MTPRRAAGHVASFALEALGASLGAARVGVLALPGLVPVAAADDTGDLLSPADGRRDGEAI